MGTEAGRAAGLYRGSNTEQGIGVLGWLRFAPCGCFFLVEAGSKKAESFSFSLLPVSVLVQFLATALSRFRNILLNSPMK